MKSVANLIKTRSVSQIDTKLWKVWWKFPLTPKLKILGWRNEKNISPTKKNIFDRRIIIKDLYPLCHSSLKNIVHLLRDCLFIRTLWFSLLGIGVDRLNWRHWGAIIVVTLMLCVCLIMYGNACIYGKPLADVCSLKLLSKPEPVQLLNWFVRKKERWIILVYLSKTSSTSTRKEKS